EDLILKVRVEGDVKNFGWVIPFPTTPMTEKEDALLFKELFDYVEARRPRKKGRGWKGEAKAGDAEASGIEVISRKIVGSFDVAVVRETEPGTLNGWLEDAGFQTLKNAEDVLDFYRAQNYVYACVKVSDAALEAGKPADLHPLRFTFKTGGRDGIYFPMKMTGLQTAPFDVNLYVFYRFWINKDLNRFGFVHRDFHLAYRDWDSPACKPDDGKAWDTPEKDPFLKGIASRLPTVKAFFLKRHRGKHFYLTNIKAVQLEPGQVRNWDTDLWLFPHYKDKRFVPYDARRGGPGAGAYPETSEERPQRGGRGAPGPLGNRTVAGPLVAMIAILVAVFTVLTAVVFLLKWDYGKG
ncbi:MAG: DUF2330 domain-containing protein, partial [Planctomycetota bacterium]